MNNEERNDLEAAARNAHSEEWCLHPNGTSVWTGEEYDTEGKRDQSVVCKAPIPFDDLAVMRMDFIATCSPHKVMELLEFYGLSDTRLERGTEDTDEVCAACGYPTTEGHTHAECFKHGNETGTLAENTACAARLAEALGVEYQGEPFGELLKMVVSLLEEE